MKQFLCSQTKDLEKWAINIAKETYLSQKKIDLCVHGPWNLHKDIARVFRKRLSLLPSHLGLVRALCKNFHSYYAL